MSVAAQTSTEFDVAGKSVSTTLWESVGVALSAAALVVGALALLYSLVLAIQFYQRPFPGFMVSYDLKVTDTQALFATDAPAWSGLTAGLKPGDQILSITADEQGTTDLSHGTPIVLNQILASLADGSQIKVDVLRANPDQPLGAGCTAAASGPNATCDVTLGRMPLLDFLGQYGVGFILGLILLGIGTMVWVMRRKQPAARTAAIICGSAAYVIAGRFDLVTTFSGVLIWAFAMCVLSGALFDVGLIFPFQPPFVRRSFIIRALPILWALFAFVLCAWLYFNQSLDVQTYSLIQLLALCAVAIASTLLFSFLYVRRRRSISPVTRDQTGIVLVGFTVAVLPIIIWLMVLVLQRQFSVPSVTFSSIFVLPPLLIFPLSMAYALLQYRLVNTDRVISEGMIYFTLGALLIIAYLLVTDAVYTLTNKAIHFDNPIIIAVTLFVISVAFTPLRLRMEKLVAQAFFRQPRLYEQRLEQFARVLPAAVEIDQVVQKLTVLLLDTITPQYIFIFLRNVSANDYEAYVDPVSGKSTTDIRFDNDSPLIRLLNSSTDQIYLGPGEAPPPELSTDRARLAVLNTPVVSRLRSANRLNGFLALGPRLNNLPYRYEDLRFLEGVCAQASSAFERGQVIVEARRNEVELKVLAQVSASLNIAMDFDTLLEFVYTQTDKVISAPNFYIVLTDMISDDLYYAFYQESGDRLPEKEGLRWQIGRDLFSEVIRTQQPLKTDNYVAESLKHDSRAHIENSALRGWMAVPLNAGGGGALGALAIATTDPNITYSQDQVRIFWNIGDLAATALYKTRLFTETEKRAKQMQVLNAISSRLASEFENIDALLEIIIEAAVEILVSEAGSLLLRDQATDDLIFQLAVGGSGQELVGTRIPAGSGIAGSVASSGKPVIVNDANQDRRWFGEVQRDDDDTRRSRPEPRKFSTRSILAVPLAARGGVLGVIEVINKTDGSPFVEEDANLLTTFASQAAVAIENARLFQTTDLALTERVQQMDTMQRIDQELNRTLDLQRVVELTITNAIKESSADAGALAIVRGEPPEFDIIGSIGYPEGILTPGKSYPITLGILGKVYRTGQLSLFSVAEMSSEDYIETLPDAKGQLAVPLVAGSSVNGILLLETARPEGFNMMTASFIGSLAEHANTAITNAQLFQRLGEANQARSRFVGFVAHELKNPMASIKGYAEVLLGGMSGQMTEQQQNFIAVIRRNVVRMQTLVDDLRDQTALETNNLTLKLAAVSFNNVIVETLRPQQRAIDDKNQKVVLNVSENLPLVWGDELRLIQIMTNFVSNANKYTPPNGTITILAEDVPNIWDDKGAPRVIHCAVSDTGIGMSDEDLKKLFTAYWRSDNPRTQEQPGTGLGMTLTRGLVEAHGGKVWVESTIDVGTTFHMTVPLATDAEIAGKR